MTFPRSLTTTPFERSSTGRFEACSCKPASGGLLPSSVQHHKLSPVFVTHFHPFANSCRPGACDGETLSPVPATASWPSGARSNDRPQSRARPSSVQDGAGQRIRHVPPYAHQDDVERVVPALEHLCHGRIQVLFHRSKRSPSRCQHSSSPYRDKTAHCGPLGEKQHRAFVRCGDGPRRTAETRGAESGCGTSRRAHAS